MATQLEMPTEPYPEELCSLVSDVPTWLKCYFGTSLALVFGCGPSIFEYPDEFWNRARDFLSICVNGFPTFVPVKRNNFTTDIWLAIDDIRNQDKSSNYPGVREIWNNKEPDLKPLRLMATVNRVSTDSDLYFDHTTEWVRERGVIKYGLTSMQAAVNWLVNETAPKRIALFGLDYTEPRHRYSKRFDKFFGDLVENLKEFNVDLVNCSPLTRVRSIKRMEWQEVFEHEDNCCRL